MLLPPDALFAEGVLIPLRLLRHYDIGHYNSTIICPMDNMLSYYVFHVFFWKTLKSCQSLEVKLSRIGRKKNNQVHTNNVHRHRFSFLCESTAKENSLLPLLFSPNPALKYLCSLLVLIHSAQPLMLDLCWGSSDIIDVAALRQESTKHWQLPDGKIKTYSGTIPPLAYTALNVVMAPEELLSDSRSGL